MVPLAIFASPNRWPLRGSVVVENDGLRYGAMGARSARRFPRPIRRHRRKAQNAQTKRAPEPPRRERILLLTKKPPYKGWDEGPRAQFAAAEGPHPALSGHLLPQGREKGFPQRFDMSAHPSVRTEIDGPISTILLSRPDKRNAVDGPMAKALLEAFAAFEADASQRVAVLHGEHG